MEKLKMQLFGGFQLEYGGTRITEAKFRSNKLICLLVYLLMNRGHVLTRQQLIGMFWEKDSRNPETALKVLMHRIRNELKELGDVDFISTLRGGYCWNPDIEVEADYEELERMAADIKKTDDPKELEMLYRGITSCYKGNVSTKVADEPWMLPKVAWYQSIYIDAAKSLCSMLEAEGQWEEMGHTCSQALQIEPAEEELYCFLIKSLFKQKKYDLALSHYEKAQKLLYEQMGVKRPEMLHEVFGEMMAETGGDMTDIGGLIEETAEQEAPEKVFFCDYQIFRQIYRMEMRRIDRLGIAEYIVLFTLRRQGRVFGGIGADHGMSEGMEILAGSIGQSLRAGDVASKYSPTQFAVLLPTCTCESGVKVAERVRRDFLKHIGNRRLELSYELAELSPSKR